MFAQPAAGQTIRRGQDANRTRAVTEYCCPSDNWVVWTKLSPSVWQPETTNDNIERCAKKGDSRTGAQIFVLLISRHLFDPSSADWWTKRGLLMVVMTIIVIMIMIMMNNWLWRLWKCWWWNFWFSYSSFLPAPPRHHHHDNRNHHHHHHYLNRRHELWLMADLDWGVTNMAWMWMGGKRPASLQLMA